MAQLISITSEALQATIRRLLPSQQGFGEDLQASNVIQPIIDLTPSAEGSDIPTFMQTAIAYGSQTAFSVTNGTTNIIQDTGFFRVFGVATGVTDSTTDFSVEFEMSRGVGVKNVWGMSNTQIGNTCVAVPFDFTCFLAQGDVLRATCNTHGKVFGSYRQVATSTGELVNPAQFTPQ